MTIRPVVTDDLPALLELYGHLHRTDSPSPSDDQLASLWRDFLTHPGLRCLVACEGATLVASCCLVVVPNLTRGGQPYAVIENVVTRAEFRRRGWGTAVVKQALALAWDAGCYKAMLMTGSKRPETLRFLNAAGSSQARRRAS